jgi:TonB family protein
VKKEPELLAPRAFESLRIAGTVTVAIDAPLANEIRAAAKDRILASYRVCLDENGAIASVKQVVSSKVAAYDRAAAATIQGWTFRPYTVAGEPMPACSIVSLVATVP